MVGTGIFTIDLAVEVLVLGGARMSSFTLRVLSYNLHKGYRTGNFAYVLSEMKAAIRDLDADIVFLQEVRGDQYEQFADQVWSYASYGQNAVYRNGNHGNAILSRFPMTEKSNFDLSVNRFERRGLLNATIEPFGRTVDLFCTHLNLFESSRRIQVLKLCEWIQGEATGGSELRPVILAGDFNDWRKVVSRELRASLDLREAHEAYHGNLTPTFPSFFPMLAVDRIYQRGFEVTASAVLKERSWARLSDHLPVVAELQWNGLREPT